jgi:D-amino-acid dehydrogenase
MQSLLGRNRWTLLCIHLQEAGIQVTIIDKGDFTDGCSFGNAGMIVPSFIPLASPEYYRKGYNGCLKKKSFLSSRVSISN